MLGDLVDLDFGLDVHLAPHADDGLHHLEVLGLQPTRGLDGELHRIVRAKARGLEQFGCLLRIIGHDDRRIEGCVFRGFQRADRRCVAAQKLVDDGLLVDGHGGRHAHVLVEHRAVVVEEDHADV